MASGIRDFHLKTLYSKSWKSDISPRGREVESE
jgi:hypothetical protein